MAPSAVDIEVPQSENGTVKQKSLTAKQPLKYSGSLDQLKSIDITPVIGTEYPEANLVDLINSPNADELLRDLAIKSKPIRAFLRTRFCSLTDQSLSAGSYSSESRITSRTISRSSSSSDLVSSLESLHLRDYTSIRS